MQVISPAPFGALTDALAKMRDHRLSASESEELSRTLRNDAQSVMRLVYEALSNPTPVFTRLEIAEGAYAALSILEASDFIENQEECK